MNDIDRVVLDRVRGGTRQESARRESVSGDATAARQRRSRPVLAIVLAASMTGTALPLAAAEIRGVDGMPGADAPGDGTGGAGGKGSEHGATDGSVNDGGDGGALYMNGSDGQGAGGSGGGGSGGPGGSGGAGGGDGATASSREGGGGGGGGIASAGIGGGGGGGYGGDTIDPALSGPGGGGGGGGGGGLGVRFDGTTEVNTDAVSGGSGGNGGISVPQGYDGGGGGGGAGALLVNGAELTNATQGTIRGGQGGGGRLAGGGGGGGGLLMAGTGTLINEGTIRGGAGGGGFIGGNGGDGVGAAGAVSVSNGSGALIAGGDATGFVIGGDGGIGVSLRNGGRLANSGEITGGSASGGSGDGGDGVALGNAGLINHGSIAGGTGGAGGSGGDAVTAQDSEIVNSGSIIAGSAGTTAGGGGSDGAAIRFTAGVNRLELWANSTIEGAVIGGGVDTLALGGDADGGFDLSQIGDGGQYRGFEQFEKTGQGTWTLTGSGAQSWTIEAGTLRLNGSLEGGSISVGAGATLAGSGAANAAVQVTAGGTLSPGNSPGILSLDSLDLEAGSTTVMEIDGPTPGTEYDQLQIANGATLNGTLDLRFGYTPAEGDRFRLIEAGSFTLAGDAQTGFTEITSNLGAALRADVEIDADSFDILVALAQQDYALFARSGNQRAVAEYLDSFSRSGQAGDLIAALNTLPAERLPSALDALSGVQHTHVQQLIRRLGTRFHQTLIARLPRGSHAAGPQRLATIGPLQGLGAAVEPGEHGAWIRAQGHQGSFEGDANAAGADYRGGGFTLGVDTAVGNAAMLGLSAGYTLSTLDSGRAALDIESAQLAAYGAWRGEHAYLGGSLSYGWHGVDSDRPVRVGTFEQSARADYHGDAVSADLEAGLPLTWSEYGRLTPFAGVSYSRFVRDGFSESGAGSANLSVSEDTDHSLLTRVGLRYGGTFETAGGTRWSPMAELAWLREQRDADSRITAGFDGIDGGFTVHGPELSRDRLRLAAGLSLEITSATRVELAYATERAADQHADHLGLSLRHVW